MSNNLNFKEGMFANLTSSDKLAVGDICFAKYAKENAGATITDGTLKIVRQVIQTEEKPKGEGPTQIKFTNEFFSILPPPGPKGIPLLGSGDNLAPAYNGDIRINNLELFRTFSSKEAILMKSIINYDKEDSNNCFAKLEIGKAGDENTSNFTGILKFYGQNNSFCEVAPNPHAAVKEGYYSYFYLPMVPDSKDPNNPIDMNATYALWTNRKLAGAGKYVLSTGDATTPIYINESGQALPCSGQVITTAAQAFAGQKTFNNSTIMNASLTVNSTGRFTNISSGHITSRENSTYSVGYDDNPWAAIIGKHLQAYGEIIDDNDETPRVFVKGIDIYCGDNRNTDKWNISKIVLGNNYYQTQDPVSGEFSSDNRNRYGEIEIYGKNDKSTAIRTVNDISTKSVFYLPHESLVMHATWVPGFDGIRSTSNVGSDTQPTYVSKTGEILAGAVYAGGTSISLNGVDKASKSASFYAPTDLGAANAILTSNGTSPVWTAPSNITVGKAVADGGGNNIVGTYCTKNSLETFIKSTTTTTKLIISGDLSTGLTIANGAWYDTTSTDTGSETQPTYLDKTTGELKLCTAYSNLLNEFSSTANTLSIQVGGGTAKTASIVNSLSMNWTIENGLAIKTTINGEEAEAVIPAASETQSGVVTIDDQTFDGDKTFKGAIILTENVSYGLNEPTTLTDPAEGQIYFKLI